MRLIDADKLIEDIECSADLGGAIGLVVECVKKYACFVVSSATTISAQPEPIKIQIDHELTRDELERLRKTMVDTPIMLLPSAQKTGRWLNVDTVIKELGAECFAKRINGELIALGGVEDYAKLRGMEVEHD